ncbi:MAG: DNA replication/repair protein RecF, partial [Thermomicrobiales bacterium]
MHISRLSLDQFRVYRGLELDLSPGGLRISGRNGSGKTSLVEAIAMTSTTRSPRSRADREMVRWNSGSDYGVPPYSRIVTMLTDSVGDHVVEIGIEQDSTNDQLFRKKFRLDGSPKRAHDIVGVLKTVLFSPEDVQLISGPPSERRRQVDIVLSQIDRTYLSSLAQYGRVLSNRNGLLRSFVKDRIDHRSARATNEIGFWDEQLVDHGSQIIAQRERMLLQLSKHMAQRSKGLISDRAVSVGYQPRLVVQVSDDASLSHHGRVQQIQAAYLAMLDERRSEEFRRGVTLIGPHRDEIQFLIGDRDLSAFGSRGQQRLAVIAYKLAETDLIASETGERPILLLDDVLSELDSVHRDMLLSAVSAHASQVIVTSTDVDLLQHADLQDIP